MNKAYGFGAYDSLFSISTNIECIANALRVLSNARGKSADIDGELKSRDGDEMAGEESMISCRFTA